VILQGTKTPFADGISEMERGDWSGAAKHFSLALHAAESKKQAAEASAYLTAVRLVEAQVMAMDTSPKWSTSLALCQWTFRNSELHILFLCLQLPVASLTCT
jgi:hypothetical protein